MSFIERDSPPPSPPPNYSALQAFIDKKTRRRRPISPIPCQSSDRRQTCTSWFYCSLLSYHITHITTIQAIICCMNDLSSMSCPTPLHCHLQYITLELHIHWHCLGFPNTVSGVSQKEHLYRQTVLSSNHQHYYHKCKVDNTGRTRGGQLPCLLLLLSPLPLLLFLLLLISPLLLLSLPRSLPLFPLWSLLLLQLMPPPFKTPSVTASC